MVSALTSAPVPFGASGADERRKTRRPRDRWFPGMVVQLSTQNCGARPLCASSSLGGTRGTQAAPLRTAVPALRQDTVWRLAELATSFPDCGNKITGQCRAQQMHGEQTGLPEAEAEPMDNFNLLTSLSSIYNTITVLESPEDSNSRFAGSRLLLLDYSGNVHSIYRPDTNWTGSYWDEFASLPAIIPDGPVAILGLGGGSSARLILELVPSIQLIGYEIDQILVQKARMYLGLAELETPTREGGVLTVQVEDALSPAATVEGGFAGIIVDLFVQGEVLPQLRKSETWKELKTRLKPGGRIMVNCGGVCVEKSDPKTEDKDGTWTWEDGGNAKDATLSALSAVFPGQVWWRKMDAEADNYLAFTGDLPDRQSWAAALPERLRKGVDAWKPL